MDIITTLLQILLLLIIIIIIINVYKGTILRLLVDDTGNPLKLLITLVTHSLQPVEEQG